MMISRYIAPVGVALVALLLAGCAAPLFESRGYFDALDNGGRAYFGTIYFSSPGHHAD